MGQKPPSLFPDLQQDFTSTTIGSKVCSYSYVHESQDGAVAVLIHGYPQSAFMWRYLIPVLKLHMSLFVPELPGYGVSTLPKDGQHSKQAVGGALLEALINVFGLHKGKAKLPRDIFLIGHDRGARIVHRLAVDNARASELRIQSIVLIDIVPTKVQWEVFSNSTASTAYFHWPFLANVELATKMIEAYGGDRWVRDLFPRWAGSNPDSLKTLYRDGALDVYANNFAKSETILGSCKDYQSGSQPEADQQEEDMKAGRKINVPTLVLFSESNLGKMHDVAHAWKDWVSQGVLYQSVGIGDDRGHFLPEEAPDEIGQILVQWLTNGKIAE